MNKPKLTIPTGVNIRDYQKTAYENWLSRNCFGIFAMATGTGKTMTSLYCVYSEYLKTIERGGSNYHIIILVPTQPLLEQWAKETKFWGFDAHYLISSEYNWKQGIQELVNDFSFDLDSDFVIISTYRSLINPDFISTLNRLPEDTILIADEAHTLGQKQIKSHLDKITGLKKRIGLSATPKRQYDEEGSMAMEAFFNDKSPYCFSLFMDKAIDLGFLCKYEYYPVVVELNALEMKEYIQISKKLALHMARNSQDNGSDSQTELLLLKRKRIINKAMNKLDALSGIIKKIKQREPLQYCFTYAPAGDYQTNANEDEQDNVRMIRQMQKIFNQESPETRTHAYLGETEDRELVLDGYAKGEIDVLLAINCLDEGIDIPRTAIGIFTASTGNPRQFIQRRGRLLRNHKDKSRALIYDMVVIPKILAGEDKSFFKIERNLVKTELTRVGYFAKLSENFYDAKEALAPICDYYQLDLDTIITELEE